MKNFITSVSYLFVLILVSLSAIAQSQTTVVSCPTGGVTTCPQTNWATPYLTTLSGTTVTSISPNTAYYLILEATQTVAPCSSIIVVTLGDGFINDETGLPYDGSVGGKDVPDGYTFSGYPYKVRIKIRTNSGVDFVSQLYFKWRMECSAATGYGTVGGGTRVPSTQKQTLIP